jgi:hypothetical protein
MQLAVGNVEGYDSLRAVLEQTVREAPGGGSNVQAEPTAGVQRELLERVRELQAAAGDESRALVDLHVGVVGHELAGLLCAGSTTAEADLAREHGSRRAGARLEEASLRQERVEPALGHGRRVQARDKCDEAHTGQRHRRLRSVITMTRSRAISTDTRSALLVATGTGLLLAPFMLGLGVAAIVSGIFVGAMVVGLGFAGTAFSGRGTVPVGAHMAFDQGIAIGLLLAAAIFIVAGDYGATAVFLIAGAVQLFVGLVTRYSGNQTAVR